METSVLIFFSSILYCKYFPLLYFRIRPIGALAIFTGNSQSAADTISELPLCVEKDKETSNNLVDLITHGAGCRRLPLNCHTSIHLQDFPEVHFVNKMT